MDRRELVWFRIPADPEQPWLRRTFATFPGSQQSGLAVGDIAGHGRPDIVCGMFWVECPVDPARKPWTCRRFGDWEDGGWGGMAKHAIADFDVRRAFSAPLPLRTRAARSAFETGHHRSRFREIIWNNVNNCGFI
jgi:hypothetical protein